jgi:protein-L-isoaspartate(D-aspartate) O-methyltransferase
MVALMTQELHPEAEDRVLEVGTGSGYQAAVLAELVSHVYTVERIADLSEQAWRILVEDLGYTNISFRVGDGTLGWPEEAPFDKIIVTAGAPEAPSSLLDQLGYGGEMVIPVGTRRSQMLTRYRRERTGNIRSENLGSCVFVKLLGEEGW